MSDTFAAVIADITAIRESRGVRMQGGKRYSMVQDRVEAFRRHFGDTYGIETTITWDGKRESPVMAKAIITKRSSSSLDVIATGHACEFWGSTTVNKTSAVENAETGAIGRALAALGIHGGEFASANELDAVERKTVIENGDKVTATVARKSIAQHKRDGTFEEFKVGLAECKTEADVETYTQNTRDGVGKTWPMSWQDAVNDAVSERKEEIASELSDSDARAIAVAMERNIVQQTSRKDVEVWRAKQKIALEPLPPHIYDEVDEVLRARWRMLPKEGEV